MVEKTNIDEQKPIYNIKAVSRLVGLLPVTLRAWERRYGMPVPERGGQGYRLYSEHDVRTLMWLKTQIDAGLNIGRAVEYLHELRSKGHDPAFEPVYRAAPQTEPLVSPAKRMPSQSLHRMYEQFLDALMNFDEATAQEILRRGFTLYAAEQVMMEVIEPTLVTLGDAWHQGKLPIAVEHYATQFCMQHLMGMLSAAAPPTQMGTIVAACAPGEQHQVGLLMMVVLLRWHGWDVKFLGPDLSLERMDEVLPQLRPHLLMFSANRVETAMRLMDLPALLAKLPAPQPLVLLGGQAFQSTRLPESLSAIYTPEAPLPEIVHFVEQMMERV